MYKTMGYSAVYRDGKGIFDLDQGRELVAPVYGDIHLITPQRFEFTDREAQPADSVSIAADSPAGLVTRKAGLIDATGKVLVPPDQYLGFEFDRLGRHLIAQDDSRNNALLDLDGHVLIAPQWESLEVDENFGMIFGYAIEYGHAEYGRCYEYGQCNGETFYLHALYDLQGKPVFTVKHTECGAEQLLNGSGKVIWPQDPTLYCERKDNDDEDKDDEGVESEKDDS